MYGIFEVLGDVGGFSEAILWLASFLCAAYTQKTYAGRFMHTMFKINKHAFNADLKEKKAKKKAYKVYKR